MRISEVRTPAYVVDEGKLTANLEILQKVQEETGCRILLAQKAFSMYSEYPLIGRYLAGTAGSGLYEARLGHEEMGKENHVFSPAYAPDEIEEIAEICDHVVFNSVSQLVRFGRKVRDIHLAQEKPAGIGLRLNPEFSTQEGHEIYDPCAPGSRLGTTAAALERDLAAAEAADSTCGDGSILSLIDGIHIHTLCEQDSDDLERTWRAVEEKFADLLAMPGIRWINLGGGHHITRADYDIPRLIRLLREIRDRYGVQVYLEPGEAIALNAGWLVTEVLDTVDNGIQILLTDASAACHMPDVLEMPYRPPLKGAGMSGEKAYTYRIAACTCLAGDVTGDYSFDAPVQPGDRLYFEDMAIYTMVKNNTFNGMRLPSIYAMDAAGDCRLVREFGYQDFRMRL